MTVVLTSFQVPVNALKGILQYIESNEFKEEFGDDLYLILHRLNQDCVESYFSIKGTCQKLAGGKGGSWNFKFGFGNEVTHPCNGSEIC